MNKITTEEEYQAALREIDTLRLSARNANVGRRLDALSSLVVEYEKRTTPLFSIHIEKKINKHGYGDSATFDAPEYFICLVREDLPEGVEYHDPDNYIYLYDTHDRQNAIFVAIKYAAFIGATFDPYAVMKHKQEKRY
jgi:hypothetical protein